MIGPEALAAMYAAVEAVGRGEAGEIELEWVDEDGMQISRLTIIVRREVKHVKLPDGEDET